MHTSPDRECRVCRLVCRVHKLVCRQRLQSAQTGLQLEVAECADQSAECAHCLQSEVAECANCLQSEGCRVHRLICRVRRLDRLVCTLCRLVGKVCRLLCSQKSKSVQTDLQLKIADCADYSVVGGCRVRRLHRPVCSQKVQSTDLTDWSAECADQCTECVDHSAVRSQRVCRLVCSWRLQIVQTALW